MELNEEDVRQLIPDETLDKIPEGYEEEVYSAVASGKKAASAVGAILHYEKGLNQKEAAEEAGISPVTVRELGDELGYREGNDAETLGYKTLAPEKFTPLIESHVNGGGKAKTYVAGIYAAITDNSAEETAEAFDSSKQHVEKNAGRVRKYLEAEEMVNEEHTETIYKSSNPQETVEALNMLDGRFEDKLVVSENPVRTANAINFFLDDSGFENKPSLWMKRELKDLIYGDDALGAEKAAEILSERVPDEYEQDLFDLTTSGNDPRIVASAILDKETDMEKNEIMKRTGAGTFEMDRQTEDIQEMLKE